MRGRTTQLRPVLEVVLGGVVLLAIPPVAALIGSPLLSRRLEWPVEASDWVAWGTIELAFATIGLAVATFSLTRLTAAELVEARRREERAADRERRGWAIEFYRAAVRVRAATLEFQGVYETPTEPLLERARLQGRDPTDLPRERRYAWETWWATWLGSRPDYIAHLDLIGADLDRGLVNELQLKGIPTVEAALLKQDDAAIIAALRYVIQILERTMLAVAAKYDLRTIQTEVQAERDATARTKAGARS